MFARSLLTRTTTSPMVASMRWFKSYKKARQNRQRKAFILGMNQPVESKDVAWSSGIVYHPKPADCIVGNKGEYPQKLEDGGIQYFGFKYYPRTPEEVDPPVIPEPLHLVIRVKTLRGRPYWEKDVCQSLGIGKDEKLGCTTIVKNNPENNSRLWQVKHLVKIAPIRLPDNLPDDPDPKCCFLKETGEFIYSPHIQVEEKDLEEDEYITKTKWSKDFIDAHTRKNWDTAWQLKLV